MTQIRVAINAITELNGKCGVHTYLIGLARELRKTATIELLLLVSQGQKALLPEELQAHAREIPGSASRSFLQFFQHRRIRKILLEERIDVYHLPNTLPILWKTVPTVVTIHDLSELRVRKYGLLRVAYRTLINFWAARVADHVLTVSENSKTDIVKFLGVSPAKVTVGYVGVEDRFQRLNREKCKAHVASRYGITSDFLLAPGGFSGNKNIRNLLLAMKDLKMGGTRIPLLLTGYGTDSQKRQLRRQVLDLGLENLVILSGYVDDRELPLLYCASSVAIYPSLYEGFGLPAIESMACGTPLVVSNTSSLPEVVGNAAISVDPFDPLAIASAVRLLVSDQVARMTFVERGLKRAADFRWERIVAKTVQVYQDAASRLKSGHSRDGEAVATNSSIV
jgi:glycosyltransferase involved in cell wall biosynthesis